MSMPDRRTVGELLADSEALARETLLDATLEQAPAMVRSWNQLVGSAVELWAVLPSAPNSPSWSDPMERLRAIGEAISHSVTAGHWPGQGPTDEHLTQIADNLSHAQHQVERSRDLRSQPPDSPADLQHAPGQVMHTLYVAAHGTVVALRRVRRGSTGTSGNCTAPAAAGGRTANRPGDHRSAGHDRKVRRVRAARRGGVLGRGASQPRTRASGDADQTARDSLGWLGGSGTPHLGQQSGSGRSGQGGPRTSAHHQYRKRPDRSRRPKGPYRHRHDAAAGAGTGGQPGGVEPCMARRWGELTNPASRTDPTFGRRSR